MAVDLNNNLPPPYPAQRIRYSKGTWFILKGISASYTFWLLYNLKKHYIGPHEHREPIKTLPLGPWYWDWGLGSWGGAEATLEPAAATNGPPVTLINSAPALK